MFHRNTFLYYKTRSGGLLKGRGNMNFQALIQIKACKDRLTPQQFKTLRGQVLAGDPDGALKGLKRILRKEKGNA